MYLRVKHFIFNMQNYIRSRNLFWEELTIGMYLFYEVERSEIQMKNVWPRINGFQIYGILRSD